MSIATELTRIQTAKANLKTQIEAKGVSVPSTATIDTYATYVQAIPQGGGGGGTDYFKITNRTATAGTITIAPATGSPEPIVFKTSTDGTNWTTHSLSASTSTGITLPANGYVMFDATESPNPFAYNTGNTWGMVADVEHNVSGKISSLAPKTPKGFIFSRLFTVNRYTNDKKLIDASGLDLDFEYLNAYMYHWMFYGCSGLIAAPALPSTHLAENCYQNMFNNCTSLVTAPELPATTLASSCYYGMFRGTNLTTAPILSATTLATGCYREMFRECPYLTSITCLAITTASNATTDWVRSISTTGTLYVADGNSVGWAQGDAGYPSTWTLQTYTP